MGCEADSTVEKTEKAPRWAGLGLSDCAIVGVRQGALVWHHAAIIF
jgi:hypothetical protein